MYTYLKLGLSVTFCNTHTFLVFITIGKFLFTANFKNRVVCEPQNVVCFGPVVHITRQTNLFQILLRTMLKRGEFENGTKETRRKLQKPFKLKQLDIYRHQKLFVYQKQLLVESRKDIEDDLLRYE